MLSSEFLLLFFFFSPVSSGHPYSLQFRDRDWGPTPLRTELVEKGVVGFKLWGLELRFLKGLWVIELKYYGGAGARRSGC